MLLYASLYKLFANYKVWKWRVEKRNHDLAPELVTYALTRISATQSTNVATYDSVSNRRLCGHGRAAILRPLRIRAWRICESCTSHRLSSFWTSRCVPWMLTSALSALLYCLQQRAALTKRLLRVPTTCLYACLCILHCGYICLERQKYTVARQLTCILARLFLKWRGVQRKEN